MLSYWVDMFSYWVEMFSYWYNTIASVKPWLCWAQCEGRRNHDDSRSECAGTRAQYRATSKHAYEVVFQPGKIGLIPSAKGKVLKVELRGQSDCLDWLLAWLIDWLADWFDWMIDWFVGWWIDWLTNWLADGMIGFNFGLWSRACSPRLEDFT